MVARKHYRQIQALNIGAANNDAARKSDTKAAKMLLIVISGFFCCWAPASISVVCLTFWEDCNVLPVPYLKASIAFAMMNSAANPIVYGIFNKKMREAYRRLLAKLFSRTFRRNSLSGPQDMSIDTISQTATS